MNNNDWVLLYTALLKKYESERMEAIYILNDLMFKDTHKESLMDRIDNQLTKLNEISMKLELLKTSYGNLLNPPTNPSIPNLNNINKEEVKD